jgi:hypothetical protein
MILRGAAQEFRLLRGARTCGSPCHLPRGVPPAAGRCETRRQSRECEWDGTAESVAECGAGTPYFFNRFEASTASRRFPVVASGKGVAMPDRGFARHLIFAPPGRIMLSTQSRACLIESRSIAGDNGERGHHDRSASGLATSRWDDDAGSSLFFKSDRDRA